MTRIPVPSPPGGLSAASTARLYAAYQGGREERAAYAQDLEMAAKMESLGLKPRVIAGENRAFHTRAVDHATRKLGIRQVLDVGCGMPAESGPNTHDIVEAHHRAARTVYVDHDPIVRAHAQALLRSTNLGLTTVVEEDLRRPDRVIDAARQHLDFHEPIAVVLTAVLHFLTDVEEPHAIVTRLVDALPSGSALVISHVTSDFDPAVMRKAEALLASARVPARTRNDAQIARFFTGLTMVDPGLVPVNQWHPEPGHERAGIDPAAVHNYGGIGITTKEADL
ncbi:SAM-dependent methyltransferase [Streptomyces albipurpureus]|uniref:SAM-dependent methyltransferase n=1 Tax=Streptomyces albipurpureus TaxID=2897419 RepID=A0ABT0UVW3_9ACTN|nr:SAM-dependent methyltransferase [Streptomyces sp. CWNU-1]MCM2392727.1 SAM-dependent methyltransferase [Streptomyces sp. CWNU-1]